MGKNKALGSNPLEQFPQMEQDDAEEPAAEIDEEPEPTSALDQLVRGTPGTRPGEGSSEGPQYQGLFGLILGMITALLLILGYMGYRDLSKRMDALAKRVRDVEVRQSALSGPPGGGLR